MRGEVLVVLLLLVVIQSIYGLNIKAKPQHLQKVDSSVYVFDGNPYSDQLPFQTGEFILDPWLDKVPVHTYVHFPTAPGKYQVYYFLAGLGADIPPEFYSEILTKMAGQGAITVAAFLFPYAKKRDNHFNSRLKDSVETVEASIQWIRGNLDSYLSDRTGGTVYSASEYLSVGCHSSGCQVVLDCLYKNSSLFKSALHLDPTLFFSQEITFHTPTMFVVTSKSVGGICADYTVPYYDKVLSPKVLVNVTDFGHCDVLDTFVRDTCVYLRICKSGEDNQMEGYHQFIAGVSTAWLSAFTMGNTNQMKYFLLAKNIPVSTNYVYYDINSTHIISQ